MRDNVFHDAPPFTAPCCGSFPGGIGIDGTDGLIEDNVFMDYVVSIRGGGSPTFRRNTVRDGAPGVPGISIDEGASPLVEDNEVTGNGVGIQIRDGDPVLRNNTVRDNSVAGISVTNGSPTLEGNTVEASKLGLGLGVNAAPILIGNVICGNETNVNVPEGSTVTVAGNETCP